MGALIQASPSGQLTVADFALSPSCETLRAVPIADLPHASHGIVQAKLEFHAPFDIGSMLLIGSAG